MPIYVYICPKCGSVWESKKDSYKERYNENCPKCKTKAKIKPSKFGFSGDGFEPKSR